MSEAVNQAVSRISAVLRSRESKEISGAKLGELIRAEAPEINIREVVNIPTGPGALSKFIEIHLSNTLQRVRKSGADWIFEIQSAGAQFMVGNKDMSYWQVFAAPSKTQSLFLELSTLTLCIREKADGVSDLTIKKIDSISKQELNEIQKKFLLTVTPEEVKEALVAVSVTSYPNWISVLRKLDFEQYHRWTEYRRYEIGQVFLNRISQLSLEENKKSELLNILMASQSEQFRQKQKIVQTSQTRRLADVGEANSRRESSNLETQFRESFLRIISNMPISELRQIQLPFGYVFDDLTRNNR